MRPVSPPPDTSEIDSVLQRIRVIVDESLEQNSRRGYFAAMYLVMTQRVKAAILAGDFQDGQRMSHFDRVFAEHYFRAESAHAQGEAVPAPWALTFRLREKQCPLALQHLLLGMNAHINYDLGLAVVEVTDGKPLASLQQDYDHINRILMRLLEEVQTALNAVSPLLALVDWIGGSVDEALGRFSIEQARSGAWRFAQRLTALPAPERITEIQARERSIAEFGQALAHPGFPLRAATALAGLLESKNVRRVTERLLAA